MKSHWGVLFATGALCCAAPQGVPAQQRVEELVVEVLATRPHDSRAFTQGLLYYDGTLLESTGQFGASELRRVDPETGSIQARVALEKNLFGEGLARVPDADGDGDHLVQLTWLAGKALVWSSEDFSPIDGFGYEGEGWGLCFDGTSLVMSDGSAELVFRDPTSFEELRRVTVTLRGRPVRGLNELECVDGEVWANVLGSSNLARIDPGSGGVTAVADASGLLTAEEAAAADVLNGIAWNPDRKVFYLTGKYWPKLFEVRLVARRTGTNTD